jgi:hypothetical protein
MASYDDVHLPLSKALGDHGISTNTNIQLEDDKKRNLFS